MKKLTNREREIAILLLQGMSNKEIAQSLYLSTHTIKANLENIYAKYDIHNRVSLAIFIYKNNLVNF